MKFYGPKRYFLSLLPTRRRAEIDHQARELIAQHGEDAYYVARGLARGGRPYGMCKDPFWTKVALRVAARTGREIGLTSAHRWPEPRG